MLKLFYSVEIVFWFDEYSQLQRVVVLLSLLEYHLVIPNPYKVIYTNGYARSYEISVARNAVSPNTVSYYQLVLVDQMLSYQRSGMDRLSSVIFDAVGPTWADSSPLLCPTELH